MEDLDMEDVCDDEEEERQQFAQEMDLGYGLFWEEKEPRDEEGEQLVVKLQALFDHFQVPLQFQRDLYALLRLDDRKLFKPMADVALASAVSEIKSHLSFHLTKIFLLFKRARGSARAAAFLKILALDSQRSSILLSYHSLARATIQAPCSKLYLKNAGGSNNDLVGGGWEDLVARQLQDEQQRSTMLQLLRFDARSKSQDSAWGYNLADGFLAVAERGVFKDRALELGSAMRREVGDSREMSVRHYRDRLAHVFECSRLPPSSLIGGGSDGKEEEEFFTDRAAPPARAMASDASYVLYKNMIELVERAREDPRSCRCYKPHQRALYDYCVDRVKELHAPLLEEFEERKVIVSQLSDD